MRFSFDRSIWLGRRNKIAENRCRLDARDPRVVMKDQRRPRYMRDFLKLRTPPPNLVLPCRHRHTLSQNLSYSLEYGVTPLFLFYINRPITAHCGDQGFLEQGQGLRRL